MGFFRCAWRGNVQRGQIPRFPVCIRPEFYWQWIQKSFFERLRQQLSLSQNQYAGLEDKLREHLHGSEPAVSAFCTKQRYSARQEICGHTSSQFKCNEVVECWIV